MILRYTSHNLTNLIVSTRVFIYKPIQNSVSSSVILSIWDPDTLQKMTSYLLLRCKQAKLFRWHPTNNNLFFTLIGQDSSHSPFFAFYRLPTLIDGKDKKYLLKPIFSRRFSLVEKQLYLVTRGSPQGKSAL